MHWLIHRIKQQKS